MCWSRIGKWVSGHINLLIFDFKDGHALYRWGSLWTCVRDEYYLHMDFQDTVKMRHRVQRWGTDWLWAG